MGFWLSTALATPVPAALLRVLYPGFEKSGYRADGRRVGWTQVLPWSNHGAMRVVLVEKLSPEVQGGPSEVELAVLEIPEGAIRVLARKSGWKGFASPESCLDACLQRVVGLDLGEFSICADEGALGVVTERNDEDVQLRELELFRFKEGALTSLGRFPQRERRGEAHWNWTWKLLNRRGQSCRDLQLTPQGDAPLPAIRRFRWTDEGYREEGRAPNR
jgi:hypothetical protein